VNVRLSKRAQRAISGINDRWRERGDHPGTFLAELLAAIDYLESQKSPGTPCPTEKRPTPKRLLLEKSKCHVYFETDALQRTLEVLTVWDGRRERPPRL
jgi:plasmid stabilization system protein ParE